MSQLVSQKSADGRTFEQRIKRELVCFIECIFRRDKQTFGFTTEFSDFILDLALE